MLQQKKNKQRRTAYQPKVKMNHVKSSVYGDFVGIVDRYKDAVVNIEVTQDGNSSRQLPFPFNLPMFNVPDLQPRATNIGTGFIFDDRGYILTNEHVIHGASRVNVKLYGKDKALPARVVGTHYEHDLAVLKVTMPHTVPILKLGHSNDVRVGEWVIAIGNPFV